MPNYGQSDHQRGAAHGSIGRAATGMRRTSGRLILMRTRQAAKFAMAILFFAAAGSISACNTISGAGEDVSAAGKGVTRGAETTKQKM